MAVNDTQPDYDVALSFAGDDRPYVEAVAKALTAANVRVFYDRYETVDLWGKNLYQHLSNVYSARARYCVVFISKAYGSKLWPRHELESAQARAFQENREYILPVRFDDTELPGLHSTTGYIDLQTIGPEELAALIIRKVGPPVPERAAPRTKVVERDNQELRAFVLENPLVRALDEQIASFTATGRLDDVRHATLDAAMTGLHMIGVQTLNAIELALGSHRKVLLELAAASLRGEPGPVERGASLTYLTYARLSEWRDVERLARFIETRGLATGEDPHVAAARIIEMYRGLTR
jgi:TIR domain